MARLSIGPALRADLFLSLEVSALVVALLPSFQSWGVIGWGWASYLQLRWIDFSLADYYYLLFAILGIVTTLWMWRRLRRKSVVLACLPVLALGGVWALPAQSFLSGPHRGMFLVGYMVLLVALVFYLFWRSKFPRPPRKQDVGKPITAASAMKRRIATRCVLAGLNLGGVILGYAAISHFKAAQYPPFLFNSLYDIGVMTIPPPDALLLFWDSGTGRVLIWGLVLVSFALVNPRWVRPRVSAIAGPFLVFLLAGVGLIGFWFWTHAVFEVNMLGL